MQKRRSPIRRSNLTYHQHCQFATMNHIQIYRILPTEFCFNFLAAYDIDGRSSGMRRWARFSPRFIGFYHPNDKEGKSHRVVRYAERDDDKHNSYRDDGLIRSIEESIRSDPDVCEKRIEFESCDWYREVKRKFAKGETIDFSDVDFNILEDEDNVVDDDDEVEIPRQDQSHGTFDPDLVIISEFRKRLFAIDPKHGLMVLEYLTSWCKDRIDDAG